MPVRILNLPASALCWHCVSVASALWLDCVSIVFLFLGQHRVGLGSALCWLCVGFVLTFCWLYLGCMMALWWCCSPSRGSWRTCHTSCNPPCFPSIPLRTWAPAEVDCAHTVTPSCASCAHVRRAGGVPGRPIGVFEPRYRAAEHKSGNSEQRVCRRES